MCVVTPSSLRKGVAAQLMSRVITEATSRGLSCVYAYVRADNKVTTTVDIDHCDPSALQRRQSPGIKHLFWYLMSVHDFVALEIQAILASHIVQAAMFLNRKFGLSQRGECKQDQSLVIMERTLSVEPDNKMR